MTEKADLARSHDCDVIGENKLQPGRVTWLDQDQNVVDAQKGTQNEESFHCLSEMSTTSL